MGVFVRVVTVISATVAMTLPVMTNLTLSPSSAADSVERGTVTSSLPYLLPVEDYSGYQPQTKCKTEPKRGILLLAAWLTARGGGYGPIGRACTGSSTTEHKEARAFDWLLDAADPTDKALAAVLLDELFAPDDTGIPHALARRMGIMYIIWNDRMYASYDGFVKKRYLSSSCRTRRTCPTTLRHRDHMHVSLTRRASRGRTSWYVVQPAG